MVYPSLNHYPHVKPTIKYPYNELKGPRVNRLEHQWWFKNGWGNEDSASPEAQSGEILETLVFEIGRYQKPYAEMIVTGDTRYPCHGLTTALENFRTAFEADSADGDIANAIVPHTGDFHTRKVAQWYYRTSLTAITPDMVVSELTRLRHLSPTQIADHVQQTLATA